MSSWDALSLISPFKWSLVFHFGNGTGAPSKSLGELVSLTYWLTFYSRHFLTAVAGPRLTGAANQEPIRPLIGSTWGH